MRVAYFGKRQTEKILDGNLFIGEKGVKQIKGTGIFYGLYKWK